MDGPDTRNQIDKGDISRHRLSGDMEKTMSGYAISETADGRFIVLRTGSEVGVASNAKAAADLAAGDMLYGYPKVTPDLMLAAAREIGRDIEDAVHVDWFREILADAIGAAWRQSEAKRIP